MQKQGYILLFLFLSATNLLHAQKINGPSIDDYNWWRNARFGIFIHWNPSSILALKGGSWYRAGNNKLKGSNKTTGEIPEVIKNGSYLEYKYKKSVPQEVYDNLFHIFNPVNFDADEWVKTFKDAGAKYIVFTTKHHDGFCMFDTKYTDYNIMNTPFGRDIAKEIAEACHKNGINVLWYYSKADWYDPRYDAKNPIPYQNYLINQIKELFSNYGEIKGVWWDGGDIYVDGKETAKAIYELQPGAIYNGRGPNKAPGIKFRTPEQKLGTFDMEHPWETCAIMQGEGWFYNGAKNIKSTNTCLRLLIDASGGDGNLLLDFGPNELGEIPPEIKKTYLEMGDWLKKYGESIYDCRGGPYKPGNWGVSTRKENKIYLHITQRWPGGTMTLPPLPAEITSAKTLTGGQPVVIQTEKGVEIKLDPEYHKQPSTIIVLGLKNPAKEIAPVKCEIRKPINRDPDVSCSSTVSDGIRGNANSPFESVYETGEIKTHYGEKPPEAKGKKHKVPEDILKTKPWLKFHRGHVWRYWMAGAKKEDPQPWLEFKTKTPVTFNRVTLVEKYSRVKSFKLQYYDKDGWNTFYEGNELGNFSLQLPELLTASRVRILITDYKSDEPSEGPAIHQFDIFN
ncbi:MAG: hypothetical protein GXO47_00805 [Chlorobi bacterium]|nr:hypothetical protein [Chlorobiota bacterium]